MSKNLTHEQLIAIADEFGTPVYIYHAERIAEQYKKLKKAFEKHIPDIFRVWKDGLVKGTTTVKAKQLFPYESIRN